MVLQDISEIFDCPHSSAKDEGVGYPLVRTPNVGRGRLLLSGVQRVSEEVYNSRNQRAVPMPGDLILAREAPVGNVAIITEEQKVCLGQRVVLIKPNNSVVDSNFLVYYLLSPEIQYKLTNYANGATVSHLNVADIRRLEVSIPDMIVQKHIGEILSSLDAKIENNNKINAKLEEIASNLFKNWFVDFAPFADGEFENSELGMIPKGWKVGKLGDVVNTTSGGTPSRKNSEYYENGNINWVKSKELANGFISTTEEMITQEAVCKSSAKMLPSHSVLIAMYGATVGEYGVISKPMTCNQAVCAMIPNENVPYSILYMWAKFNKENLINKAVGSAQQNISQVIIKDLDVIYSFEAFEAFDKVALPLLSTIENNSLESSRLATLRDTLLPKLMSGEIDLDEINDIS